MADVIDGSGLGFDFTPTGEGELIKALDGVKAGLTGVAEAQKKTTEATGKLDSATNNLTPTISKFKQGISSVGSALSALSPEAGRAVSVVSNLTGSIGASTSRLGLWGAALGVVTTGLGFMAQGIAEADAEAKKWTDRLNDSTIPTLDEFIQKITQAQRAAAQASLRALNVAGVTDAQARQNQIATRLEQNRATQRGLEASIASGDLTASDALAARQNIERLAAEAEDLRAQNQRAREELHEAAQIEREIQQEEAQSFIDEYTRREADARRREEEARERERAARGRAGDAARRAREAEAEARERELERNLGRAWGESQSLVSGLTDDQTAITGRGDVTAFNAFDPKAEEARSRQQAADEEEARQKRYQEMYQETAQIGLEAARMLTEGELQESAKRLKAKAVEEAWLGAAALAIAVGNTIFNPPGAASKYAEAAQHFAIAAALGGLGAVAGAAAGGGGKAGGSGGQSRERPDRFGGQSSNDNGGAVVINVNAPAIVTQGALAGLGREIRGAMEAA